MAMLSLPSLERGKSKEVLTIFAEPESLPLDGGGLGRGDWKDFSAGSSKRGYFRKSSPPILPDHFLGAGSFANCAQILATFFVSSSQYLESSSGLM